MRLAVSLVSVDMEMNEGVTERSDTVVLTGAQ